MVAFAGCSEKTLQKAKKRREKELLESLVLFPGSVEEYERFRGYRVEIVDTARSNKSIFYNDDKELVLHLIEQEGVEALVNASYKPASFPTMTILPRVCPVLYGLPVRRKQ
ncbi:MAG TPA: hypothetical protein VJ142_02735 [Candidatus Nanoarchaeia archaeon]|nr:hypothetical protein [Candidatus Nanoarchaeia archaeon]